MIKLFEGKGYMIDKLHLSTSASPDKLFLHEVMKEHNTIISKRNDYWYDTIWIIRIPNQLGEYRHLCSLYLDPVGHNVRSKLQVNPSSLEGGVEELEAWVDLLGFGDSEITRVDCAVDIPVSIHEVLTHIHIPRKSSREIYRKLIDVTGVYLGKIPEQYVVYDKARQLKQQGDLTRIEVRLHRNKIPFKMYSDFHSYADYFPFSKVQFLNVEGEGRKKEELEGLMLDYGFSAARKMLNGTYNFKRDYSGFVCPLEPSPNYDLRSLYEKEVSEFFKGEQ